MRDFIPTEEEFDSILASLAVYERQLEAEALVNSAMKNIPINADDSQAFESAFASKLNYEKVRKDCAPKRDALVLISAKIIMLRDFMRKVAFDKALDELIK